MHTNPRPLALLTLLFSGLPLAVSRGDVKVVKQSAVIQTRTFDPTNAPKDMHPLGKGEAALTVCDFRCDVNSQYRVDDHPNAGNGDEATAKIYVVTVTTHLSITIWVPDHAPAKLIAHEEGHRQIAQAVYQDAENVANAVGKEMDHRRVNASGENAQDAVRAEIEKMSRETSAQYLAEIAVKAAHINDIYDDLTAHGTRNEPVETEAIKLSFNQFADEQKAADEESKSP